MTGPPGSYSGRIFWMRSSNPRPPEAKPPWRPTPLIRGSVVLHAGAIGLALVRPHLWPWALSAVVADHLFITAAGLTPRSALLGPNWTRLPARPDAMPAVAIPIDDGPDAEVTPHVLDLLDEHHAQATFFCIGARIVRHGAIARDIVRRGHEIGNHSYRHLKRFSLLGPRAIADEVMLSQPLSRAGAGARRARTGELDAARLRHRQRQPGRRARPPHARPRRARHLAAARWQRRAHPRRCTDHPGSAAAPVGRTQGGRADLRHAEPRTARRACRARCGRSE